MLTYAGKANKTRADGLPQDISIPYGLMGVEDAAGGRGGYGYRGSVRPLLYYTSAYVSIRQHTSAYVRGTAIGNMY